MTEDHGGPRGLPRISLELADDPRQTLIELLSTFPYIIGSSPTPIADGSRMAGDRQAAQGLIDLPSLCQHYVSGANDFLGGLERLLLVEEGRLHIPRYSAYPLIRGVIESSAQAAWVLGPSDRRYRFMRLLQIQKAELDFDRRYVAATTSSAHLRDDDTDETRSNVNKIRRQAEDVRARRLQLLREVAAAVGVETSAFERGLVGGYESVVYHAVHEAHLADGELTANECHWLARHAASASLFISGLSHPSVSRAWANASETGPGDSVERVETASNPIVTRDSLLVGLRLQGRAFIALEASLYRVLKSLIGRNSGSLKCRGSEPRRAKAGTRATRRSTSES